MCIEPNNLGNISTAHAQSTYLCLILSGSGSKLENPRQRSVFHNSISDQRWSRSCRSKMLPKLPKFNECWSSEIWIMQSEIKDSLIGSLQLERRQTIQNILTQTCSTAWPVVSSILSKPSQAAAKISAHNLADVARRCSGAICFSRAM